MFLTESELTKCIWHIVEGGALRCAVAFWGQEVVGKIPFDARIVCDISMGATNPKALEQLGAPDSSNLRHIPGLHAKLYLSDRGMVVSSANASEGSISPSFPARHIEAGAYFDPDSKEYEHATKWFEQLWEKASLIDESALDDARRAWRARERPNINDHDKEQRTHASIVEAIFYSSERFKKIGFAVTTSTAKIEDRDIGAECIIESDKTSSHPHISEAEITSIRNWPKDNVFCNWDRKEIKDWPGDFISIHKSKSRLYVSFMNAAHKTYISDELGTIFATKNSNIKKRAGLTSSIKNIILNDEKNIGKLISHLSNRDTESTGWYFRDGREFRRELIRSGVNKLTI